MGLFWYQTPCFNELFSWKERFFGNPKNHKLRFYYNISLFMKASSWQKKYALF